MVSWGFETMIETILLVFMKNESKQPADVNDRVSSQEDVFGTAVHLTEDSDSLS